MKLPWARPWRCERPSGHLSQRASGFLLAGAERAESEDGRGRASVKASAPPRADRQAGTRLIFLIASGAILAAIALLTGYGDQGPRETSARLMPSSRWARAGSERQAETLSVADGGMIDQGAGRSQPPPQVARVPTPPPGSPGRLLRIRAGGPLAKPVFPRCGVKGFGRPVVTRLGASGWRLLYRFAPGAHHIPLPGQTLTLTIVERSADGPAGRVPEARSTRIAGHAVSFRDGNPGSPHMAAWKTRAAVYLAVADGRSTRTLKQVVSCLP